MNDKQLAALFMAHVLPAIRATDGLENVKLKRNYQQRQQGGDTTPYVYFVKLGDKRYGSPVRKDQYRTDLGDFQHVEAQQYESTYQISAMIPQNPADIDELTESDILNVVSGIIQSDEIIEAFRASNVGILRVTDVRNPYVLDDRDQFKALPTFDVVLTYRRQRVTTLPAVVTFDAQIRRV